MVLMREKLKLAALPYMSLFSPESVL